MNATPCPRHLPQHFNGCTCVAVPGAVTAEVDIDLMGPADQAPVTDAPEADEGLDASPYMPNEFTFPAWKTDRAVASIEKANRRAERAGIAERFTYDITTFEKRSTDPATGIDKVEEMATLRLNRPSVRHEGWEFTGTLTWDDEVGMISRIAPGANLIDRPDERTCDVCGQQRDRKDTYVVQRTDPDTGEREQLQVGSNCLTRFMGIRPAGLFMLEFDVDTEGGPREASLAANEPARRDARQVLGLALAVVEQHGWVSRSAARAYAEAGGEKAATADIIDWALNVKPPTDEARRHRDELLARAAELSDDADALLEEARTMEGDSEYAINMRAVASGDSVSHRNIALLASAVAARNARVEREAKAKAASNSEYVGAVKSKIENHPVTVESVRYIDGDYGVTTLVSMRDTDGNVIKWFASGSKEFEVGKKFSLRGTVKGHDVYQDVKETTVTRAKLEPA